MAVEEVVELDEDGKKCCHCGNDDYCDDQCCFQEDAGVAEEVELDEDGNKCCQCIGSMTCMQACCFQEDVEAYKAIMP